jgi:uncharacterized protein YukE
MVDILVQPPELRKISDQLRSSAQKIGTALQAIDNDIISLKGDKFLGSRSDKVQAHYAPKREALLKAKNIVLYFANDLQNIATVFEQADDGDVISSKLDKNYMKNARQLAGGVDKYYAENAPDVEIVRIGENEYIILLPGTKGGQNWNNWGGAITTGMGVETPFERQINDLILKSIPPGATIHFAGHSQGGILAQNLVEHQANDLLKGYSIGSVTTYGSPESAYKVEGVAYSNYELIGDPVSLFDQNMMNPVGLPIIIGAGLGFMGGNEILGMNAFEPHGLYKQVIAQDNLPFQISEWTVVGSDYADSATTGLAGFETSLHSGDPLRIVGDGLVEIPRGVAMAVVTLTSNSIEALAPPSIAQNVDHFSESALQYVSEFDEVQFAQNAGNMVVNAGGEVVNFMGNTVSAVGHVAGSIGSSIASGVGSLVGGLF